MHKNSRVKSDNDLISVSLVTLVTSHQPLIPALKLFGVSLSRIVIESTAEGSFLHCGQYRIGIGRETTTWRYVFLLSHMHVYRSARKISRFARNDDTRVP